ncbi:MFS transporter [Tsukamurella sp. 8F]|uniref:MFS transporter n=1 Tax=unclassified Tsukamurella TaxID=2633480 RepID=UPI0023B96FB5|nr:MULTISPECIES: MFS transporter [unclassified Tsukamurella]MDF0529333.1 MFS transporter [Tsukamurella sp. 8J]MDF0587160.1 MFS transporter [Tsukamurella sp. 8F]
MPTELTRPAEAAQPTAALPVLHCRGPRYKWGVLGIGVGAQAAFSIAFQGIPTSGPVLQAAYHLTTHRLGIVLAAVTCGIAITEVAWGIITDRIGERPVLITGLTGTTIMFVLAALFVAPHGNSVPSYWLLSAVLLIAGASGGCINSTSGRAVMGWFGPSERGFAISIRATAVPVGGAIGAAVLPPLGMAFGFRWVFVFLAALSALATAAVVAFLEDAPIAKSEGAVTNTAVENPLRRWVIWRIALVAFLLDLPQFTVLTFGAIFLHQVEHMSIGSIAALLVIVQVLGGASRVIGGKWTDLQGGRYRRRIVRIYSWLIAAGFVLLSVYSVLPTWAVATLLVVSGALACGWHGVHYADIAVTAGAERSGTALGLENTMVFGGAFITPIAVSALLPITSWSPVMLLVGAIPALAAVFLMPREPRVAAVPRRRVMLRTDHRSSRGKERGCVR